MKVKLLLCVFSVLLLKTCAEDPGTQDPLKQVLLSEDPYIRQVMDKVEEHELQIIYTRIERRADSLLFHDYNFQVDKKDYFYPASTVKFPIAVTALEKLNELDSLDRNVRYYIEGDTIENTFAEDIIKIFTVSDNHANNRLLEFLGQDDINNRLLTKGISPVRISHRLGVHSDEVTTRPLVLYMNDSTTALSKPIVNKAPEPLLLNGIKKGRGFYKADSLYAEPFDFKLKNYYPLFAQHEVLKRVVYPEYYAKEEQFKITQEQRAFLLEAMQMLPREAGYDEEEYYDGYCKFFLYGDTLERIPDHLQIYNKVGFAYGTLTDCAYIRDELNKVEFMVSATLLVNQDGIFNDDAYEYDEVGIPFLAALGRALYTFERSGN
ncbi:class A beta-lactamase-related serine hydrolase [Flavobacteriaceae bacterium D16]|nr:class A beta-lactamase-related serine hydrolase [Flavobacteriaceae bacterium D16]